MAPRLPRGGGGPTQCFRDTRELDEWLLPDEGDVHVAGGRLSKCPAYNRLTEIKRESRGAEGSTPQTLEDCTNRQLRVVVYYKIFLDLWENEDRPDKSKREKIPICVEQAVRKRYPDDAQDRAVKEALSKSKTDDGEGDAWDYRFEKTLAELKERKSEAQLDEDDDKDREGYECTSIGYPIYIE